MKEQWEDQKERKNNGRIKRNKRIIGRSNNGKIRGTKEQWRIKKTTC
jgi:hypothetical protein